jgi:hypothetical protein
MYEDDKKPALQKRTIKTTMDFATTFGDFTAVNSLVENIIRHL